MPNSHIKKYSYPRERRLVNSDDFKRIFKNPDKIISRELSVFARANQLDMPRLGTVISRKHVKKAVQRNLIKRIVREQFRLKQYELGGLDIIVVANKKTASLDKVLLKECLKKLWQDLIKQPVTS